MMFVSARWSLLLLVALALFQVTMTTPLTSRDLAVAEHSDIMPADEISQLSEQVFGPELKERGDRDKRKVLELKLVSGLGVKNYLLNLIFGKINQAIDYKTSLVNIFDRSNIQKNAAFGITGGRPCRVFEKCVPRATTPRPRTTTEEDILVLNPNAVSLDIPSTIFGSSFTVVNRISQIIGRVVQNSAERTQVFVEALKPVFGKALGIDTTKSIRDSSVETNLVTR